MRSFTAPFLARGDTATPVKAALIAVFANILLKIVLVAPLAQVGLALATAVGAWINLALLIYAARKRDFQRTGVPLERPMRLIGAGVALGIVLYAGERVIGPALSLPRLREEALLLILVVLGAAVYGALVIALLGRTWLKDLARDSGTPPARPELSAAD
jgi:putative peptidoglycan lipid II flippase